MIEPYNPHVVEAKWRQLWPSHRDSFQIPADKEPYYVLDMISYPSSEGLHMGHWRPYTIADVWARYQTLLGKHVLSPVGFDSFGLPAENAAIKTSVHPADYTTKAIANFRRQILQMGKMYDWSTEIVTSSPEYYRWTQWLFIELYNAGLAYKKSASVNWCPRDKTVLANEQVIAGRCERCDSLVEKRQLKQWFFKITEFAEQLLDFDGLDWPNSVKTLQSNWIGKSTGAKIVFDVADSTQQIEVFTTRPDTIYGATYLVIAPEHEAVRQITSDNQRDVVERYVRAASQKTDLERQDEQGEKSGVYTGANAIHPLTGNQIPIWIADYVLASYGTGAIMAVPAHDERDFQFATTFELPIKRVITAPDGSSNVPYSGEGNLVESGEYSGLHSTQARLQITNKLAGLGKGREHVVYRLRDWLVSRQRLWGTPIPILYCENCGEQPVPQSDLPVVLPIESGYSVREGNPLAHDESFRRATCPVCGGAAVRETDTLDTFVDSSWYYARFTDPRNPHLPFSKEQADAWLPVDFYVGGTEHSILHLLYARFVCKALHRLGYIAYDEPFTTFYGNGMVYLHGSKMSKSKGNIVNPDDMVRRYGADALRGYILFMGPANQDVEWQENGIVGVTRFLESVWRMVLESRQKDDAVADDIAEYLTTYRDLLEKRQFNRTISELMKLIGARRAKGLSRAEAKTVVHHIAPIFPHIAEELWQRLGGSDSVFAHRLAGHGQDQDRQTKPVAVSVQVKGKHRGIVWALPDASQETVVELIRHDAKLSSYIPSGEYSIIYRAGRVVNFVVQ